MSQLMLQLRLYNQLNKRLSNIAEVQQNESMKNHTTLKVGGKVDFFITPNSISDIKEIMSVCESLGLVTYIIGNGSNLIVGDKGIRGTVIHIGKTCNKIEVNGSTVTAEAGVYIPTLVNTCVKNRLKGIEIITGIPGNLGGTIYMNGGYTRPISNIIKSVTVLRGFGIIKLNRSEILFSHRTSSFQFNDDIILSAELELEYGNCKNIVRQYIVDRQSKQPLHHPSCGSVFKQPGKQVYKLKGISVGDATYSKGFILNMGNATSRDVVSVIDRVEQRAKRKLNLEAELIGDF